MSSHALRSVVAYAHSMSKCWSSTNGKLCMQSSSTRVRGSEPATLVQHWQGWSAQHTACVGTPWLEQTTPWRWLAPTGACSTRSHSWLQPSCLRAEPDSSADPAGCCLPPEPGSQLGSCHHHPHPGCPCQDHRPRCHCHWLPAHYHRCYCQQRHHCCCHWCLCCHCQMAGGHLSLAVGWRSPPRLWEQWQQLHQWALAAHGRGADARATVQGYVLRLHRPAMQCTVVDNWVQQYTRCTLTKACVQRSLH